MKINKLGKQVAILSFFILFISSLSIPQEKPFVELTESNDMTSKLNNSSSSGNSKPLLINQFATAITTTTNINLPTITSFTLAKDWFSSNIRITCNDTLKRTQIVNNTDIPTGNRAPWSFYTNYASVFDDTFWFLSSNLPMDIDPGTDIPGGSIGYFWENVTVDDSSSSAKMAELSFDFQYSDQDTIPSNTFLYAAVIIGDTEYNSTIEFSDLVQDQWTRLSLSYNLSTVGQSLPGEVSIRLGAYINDTVTISVSNDLNFDNINFHVWTIVDEPDVLIAKDNDSGFEYSYQNTSIGQGKFTIDVQKNYTVAKDIIFLISKNSTYTEDFFIGNLTITSPLSNNITSTIEGSPGTGFQGADDIQWEFELPISIPTSYNDKWVRFEKPSDWFVYSIVDGFQTNQTSLCTGTEYNSILTTIPIGIVSNGNWQIIAKSFSYFEASSLEFWNGTDFIQKSDFYINEDFQFNVEINNSVAFSDTYMNISLLNPNGTIFYEEFIQLVSFDVVFGNYTVGQNMSLGEYTAEILWTNNESSDYVDKVGFSSFNFNVIHNSTLYTSDTYLDTVPGQPLLVYLNFEDSDLSENIEFGTISYSSTAGDSGDLTYVGSGTYVLDLDTSSYNFTDYYLSFNASKQFYVNQSISNLIQLNMIREGMILDVPRQINIAQSNSYAIFEFNLTGEISNNYIHPANISSDWMAPYSITNYNNGTYKLNASTTGVTTGSFPETFVINVYANKTDYSETSDVLLLQIHPIGTEIGTNISFIRVPQGQNFTVKVNYTESEGGTLIDNADCIVDWDRDTSVISVLDGFVIVFNSTSLDLGQYTALIQINKTGYETRSLFLTILIEPLLSELVLLNPEPLEFFKGDDAIIGVQFLVDDQSFANASVSLVGDFNGVMNWNGTAYIFDINTSVTPKIYYSQIFAQSSGVQTQVMDLFFRIRPVVFDIEVSSSNFLISGDSTRTLFITVFDESHGEFVTDVGISGSIEGIAGNVASFNNGTYSIDLDQFELRPSINPYTLNIIVLNLNGEDYTINISVIVPRDLSLYWWISAAVGGSSLLGLLSFLIYNRYIKLSRFQRDLNYMRKNISSYSKIKGIKIPSRHDLISDIINEEIDKLHFR